MLNILSRRPAIFCYPFPLSFSVLSFSTSTASLAFRAKAQAKSGCRSALKWTLIQRSTKRRMGRRRKNYKHNIYLTLGWKFPLFCSTDEDDLWFHTSQETADQD
ncbi:uncharacterized protein LOC119659979 [Hermetia illucens]|uniref:uncharacterized protein LOC119659979 n=1 Tax=Hermetia illucens TaxID=343691 RepID=UPI0018CC0D92|nr:uncharacterized protein LOC119659979 [Hermetia illucens]